MHGLLLGFQAGKDGGYLKVGVVFGVLGVVEPVLVIVEDAINVGLALVALAHLQRFGGVGVLQGEAELALVAGFQLGQAGLLFSQRLAAFGLEVALDVLQLVSGGIHGQR